MTSADKINLLNSLSSTQEIFDILWKNGIKGAKMTTTSCPVARYIGGQASVRLSTNTITFWEETTKGSKIYHEKNMSSQLFNFVCLFDGGHYPELEFPKL